MKNRPSGPGMLMLLPVGLWALWAVALALFPTLNTDLYWHLGFGRWILEHHAVPRSEFLSYTLPGAPWIDFEWLTQVLLFGAHAVGGCSGLLALRALLVLGAAALTARTLALQGVGPLWRGLAGAGALAVALVGADVRADNISMVLFAATLLLLEARRLGPGGSRARAAAAFAGLFALWANLHLGLAYGLLLILLYGIGEALQGRRERARDCGVFLVCAAAATLLNPYGWRLYQALWEHARTMGKLQETLIEWGPADITQPAMIPFFILLLAAFAAVFDRVRRGRRPCWPQLLALGAFGFNAARHQRHIPYFAWTAVPATAWALRERAFSLRLERRAAWGLGALIALFWFVCVAPALRPGPGAARCWAPGRGAAAFFQGEGRVFAAGRVYHPVEWGGTLAYALGPSFKIFSDGRYVFEGLVEEEREAFREPQAWARFLDARGVTVACLPRFSGGKFFEPLRPGEPHAPLLPRPLYARLMPAAQWALVYWDDEATVFARRSPAAEALEFRALLPDDYARAEARLGRREITREDLRRELRRRAESSRGLDQEVPAIIRWLDDMPGGRRGA